MSVFQFFAILKARFRLAAGIFFGTVLLVAAVSLILPKTYTAGVSLVADFKGADPLTGLTLPAQLLPGHLSTQADIIASHNVALKVVDRLGLADQPGYRARYAEQAEDGEGSVRDWLADLLLKDLEVKPARDSNVMRVEFSARDPHEAARVANAFADSYQAAALELRTDPAKQYSAWFEDQIKGLRDRFEAAQERLSHYQRGAGVVALDERLDVETAKLAELARQLAQAQAQALDARSRKGNVSEATPDIQASLLIQKLKGDLSAAESSLAEAAEKYGVQHPIYVQAQAQAHSLKRRLAAEMKAVASSLAAAAEIASRREADFQAAFAEQKAKILELNGQKDQIAVLAREVDNAQQAYMTALQRFNQTRLESEARLTNVAILNPAIPPLKPSRPKLLLNLVLAVCLGGCLAVGSILLMELLDRRIRSAEDLAFGLDIPVLGVLEVERREEGGLFLPGRRDGV